MTTQPIRRPAPRSLRAPLAAAALAVVLATAPLAPAAAGPSSSARGSDGQTLTVSQVSDLDPAGQQIEVTGSGFPTFKGVYVAVCKVTAPGTTPTPCAGGIDTSGSGTSSQWVSSNPPSYGKGLAVPYTKGGGFDVTIFAAPTLPNGESCIEVECAVVTRADHTRASDRSQDVVVPIAFAAADSDSGTAAFLYWAGGLLLGLVLIVAVVVVALRRVRSGRSARPTDDAGTAAEVTP